MTCRMVRTSALAQIALVVGLGMVWQAQAGDAKKPYLSIAPLDQYLIADADAEIVLARSAAPESISHDAGVLLLGRHGYETAVKSKNGFVCVVERAWMLPYDDPEFLNPEVRLPLCVNLPAARSHLPFTFKATQLALAGLPKSQMFNTLKAAFDKKELPLPEAGSMCYMMSKRQYFGPQYGNADPHLMFWFARADDMTWGADLPGSPVFVHQDSPDPITTFIISASQWSDGTPGPAAVP
ncbi:MAG: hypothetical protein WB762_07340 [Candidatus Sulfotelmatobacter sp.]